MINNSILPPEVRGVVKMTGYRGKGKTSFLIKADRPELTAFLDFEHKGRGFHNQLGFGFYKDMVAGTSGPNDLYDVVIETIAGLEPNRYTVAILDNCAPLELALQAGARRNTVEYCQEYGLNIRNVKRGAFGGLRSVVNYLISDQICSALHGKGIQMIGITHHIARKWGVGGIIPNKKRIKGADRWMELAILSLVIVEKGDFPPVPSAMVEKEQLSTIAFDEAAGEFVQQRRLPFRLPQCTWSAIKHYLEHPADLTHPGPGEAIVQEEFDVFSDRLSGEQIALMRLSLEKELRERKGSGGGEEVSNLLSKPKPDPILTLAQAGKSAAEIAKELGKPLPVVRRLLEGLK